MTAQQNILGARGLPTPIEDEADERLRTLALAGAEALMTKGKDSPLVYSLKDADEPYRKLIERMSNPVAILDDDATILYCNGLLGRFLGREPQKGANFLRLVTEESLSRAGKLLSDGVKREAAAELALYASDGRRIDVLAFAAPIAFNDRACVTLVVTGLGQIEALKISQADLRKSDERFRAIFEHAGTGIAITDCKGFFQQANPAYCRLIGYTQEELRKIPFSDLVHPDDRDINIEATRRVQCEEVPHFEVENRYIRKDGQIVWVHKFVSLLHDDGDGSPHVLALVTDCTERRRMERILRESRAELQAELEDTRLLQSISAELLEEGNIQALYERILDAALRIMQAESGSIQMLYPERGRSGELKLLAHRGFTPQAAKRWEWISPEACWVTSCAEALRTRQRVIMPDIEQCALMQNTEDLAAFLDSGIHACHSTPLFSRSGDMVGMISTHWKHSHHPSERDLRLCDILVRQAADLIERKQVDKALRDASRRKDEFLAMLAHELRNPLAPIRNALHVLERTDGKTPNAKRLHAMMARQVTHLVRLVDDLLEVSRITSGKIELRKQPVDLRMVIRQAIETSQPFIEAERHQLIESLEAEPLILNGDPVRLTQIFANLLNNSAKYTPPGGRIEISTRREGGDAVVSVRDNGMGIKPDVLPRVFDLFTQSDRAQREAQGGIGVGLALARGLVDLHDGQICVHSEGEGHGCEFVVRLPLAATFLRDDEGEGNALSANAAALRVLVADDDHDVADSLAMLLQAMGAEVRVAYGGKAAIELLPEFKPQLVLLDIGMPVMNGYETARRMRELTQGSDIVIAALSGWGQEGDRQRSFDAGFDHHFVKPLEIETLEKLLASIAPRIARQGCEAGSA